MAQEKFVDWIPAILVGVFAWFLFQKINPKQPAKTLTVTGIKYGGAQPPSVYDVSPPSDGNFMRPTYIQWLKGALNHIIGSSLDLSHGAIDSPLISAVWSFQETWMVPATGAIDAQLDTYIRQALGQPGYI